MNVVEIKNNLVKIAYEPKDNLALAGFVIIEDENSPYVAQIMNLRADNSGNFAVAKLLFTFNDEGILKSYNGTIPSLSSVVSNLPAQELLDVIPVENPVIFGRLAQQNIAMKVDKSVFENNLLICSDNVSNTFELIGKLASQLREKVVVIDTEGNYPSDEKIVFSDDFKLPLNYQTIDYVYENDLDDVDAVSKAVIQDIFKEVQEYTKTLTDGFLPFDSFYNVVDAQYAQTQIPQLVLLKNKLQKYKEAGVFAQNHTDILGLTVAVENKSPAVIDISNVKDSLQKELINYIYSVLNNLDTVVYSFVKVANDNSDKKLLRLLTANTNVYTTLICSHEYKYVSELKEIAQNLVLFTPQTLQHDFLSYNSYLNKLNGNEFIIYGAHTQNIPLIVELAEVSEDAPSNPDDDSAGFNEFENSEDEFAQAPVEPEDAEAVTVSEEAVVEELPADEAQHDDTPEVEVIPESSDEILPVDNILSDEEPIEQVVEELSVDETLNEATPLEDTAVEDITVEEPQPAEPDSAIVQPEETTVTESYTETPVIDETPVEDSEVIDDEYTDVAVDITEEDNQIDEIPDNDEPQIIEEPTIAEDESVVVEEIQEPSDDDIVEQVAKDVDKVFYEKLPADDDIEEDVLTEDDLNLIDDLENIEPEEPEVDAQTPVVPIYPADDIEENEVQTFEPGDRVSTPKYGEGVVENMVKYGDKLLCSIDFPNIGRRLLNPAVTDIKKLS